MNKPHSTPQGYKIAEILLQMRGGNDDLILAPTDQELIDESTISRPFPTQASVPANYQVIVTITATPCRSFNIPNHCNDLKLQSGVRGSI